ncbi:MAG TPA: VCBS repeat-containing protein, partial [Candidatus Eisenbacteria bacterium]|nr:VCBS repeat-containing protein [Candidatus Eisenbacteria bacterium]
MNGDGTNDLVVTSDGVVKVLLGGLGGTLGPPTDVYAIGNAIYVLIQDLTGDGRNDLVLSDLNVVPTGAIVVLPGLAGGGFGPPVSYPTGISPYPFAVGDLNGDGILDIASGEAFGNRVSVMIGLPGGGFGPDIIYTLGPAIEIQSVAIGDLDGDGRNDVAVGGPNISATVLYGQASGGFGTITEYDTGGISYVVGIADLNADGRMDLATVNGLGAVVYSGLPGGLLGSRADYVVPGDVNGLAIGDLNGDTRLDLVLGAFLTIGGPGTGSVTTLPGLPGGGFGAPSIYDSGEGTGHVAIGDLDGDGQADIAASHFDGTTVTVLSDLPDPPTPYYTGGRNHSSVVLGDLNGDGRPDMAAPNGAASFPQATVFTSLPGGGFSAADYGAPRTARSIATGDVDGDGRIDLVVANTGASPLVNPGTVSVLPALPGGGYGTNTDYAVGVNPAEIKLSDLDGDGWLDIVTANTSSHDVSVLMGQPGGTFGAETRYPTAGSGPAGLGVGDLDGDGRPDLAVLNATTRTISVMVGLGAGSFGAPTLLPTPTLPGNPVAIGDVNGDGMPDMAIASRVSTTPGTIGVASIYLGIGGGVFAPRTDYLAGPGVTSVAIGDLDGDGVLDLAAGGLGGLFVLLGLPGGSFGPPAAHSGY